MAWIVGIGLGLFLLFNFPRATLTLIGVLTVGGFVGVEILRDSTKRDLDEQARQLALVTVQASGDKVVCNDAYNPIKVQITNNSSSATLMLVRFNVSAYKPGYSTSVLQWFSLSSDRILKPGEVYTGCWPVSDHDKPPEGYTYETLQWEVRKASVTWR